MLSPPEENPPSRKSKKAADSSRKTESVSGLMKTGQNPYPVFLLLKKVQRFSRTHLVRLLQLLGEADERLKSGALHPRAVLEHVVLAFCIDDAALKP
jgi:DNA polymerase-3 subunit delta